MILKIDTTQREEITVSLIDDKGKETNLSTKQKLGSQALLPLIIKALKKKRLKFSDLSAIEVNSGPGSFTGTRVGVTVANVLGYALNIPVNGKKNNVVIPKYEKSKFD